MFGCVCVYQLPGYTRSIEMTTESYHGWQTATSHGKADSMCVGRDQFQNVDNLDSACFLLSLRCDFLRFKHGVSGLRRARMCDYVTKVAKVASGEKAPPVPLSRVGVFHPSEAFHMLQSAATGFLQ